MKEFLSKPEHRNEIERLRDAGIAMEIEEKEEIQLGSQLDGKTFVISGVFERHSRDELKELIVSYGGKVLSSVSGKLDYLLAGDNMGPSKREKAEKLNIQIITESDFESMITD